MYSYVDLFLKKHVLLLLLLSKLKSVVLLSVFCGNQSKKDQKTAFFKILIFCNIIKHLYCDF